MGRTYALNPARQCDYSGNMRNLWDLPLDRLSIYCDPFEHPGGYFKVSSQATCHGQEWIGMERYLAIIEETIPYKILSLKEKTSLLARHFKSTAIDLEHHACVLIDYLNIKSNYFHWFLDALPRILAAEAYRQLTGHPFSLIVPQKLQPWQSASLHFLGIQPEQLLFVGQDSSHRDMCFERLITTYSHRHIRRSSTGHFDAMGPEAIKAISKRLLDGAAKSEIPLEVSQRLYIARGNVQKRRVSNEEALMTVLSRYGFELVSLDGMPLQHQIQIFRKATHIISAHGGALTNLLYIPAGCQVLEIFQTGHGLRPDFFQLAALGRGLYSFNYAQSYNEANDIEIPIAVLQSFLEASL